VRTLTAVSLVLVYW